MDFDVPEFHLIMLYIIRSVFEKCEKLLISDMETHGTMFIILGNGHSKPSSNPGQGSLHFILC